MQPDLISRKEAKLLGLKRFFTGKPCSRGHIEQRGTSNGSCVICDRDTSKQWFVNNRQKANNRRYQWRIDNLEKARLSSWKSQGMPEPLRPMPEVCEVCGKPETSKSKSGVTKSLALDHCHTTGAFRGWLCYGCNSALGHVRDSPVTLQRLADYLQGSL